MLLAYVDETGINHQQQKGFFIDGPYAMWSAVLIPESKYFHLERLFYSLAQEVLGVKDWKKAELHGNVLWASRGESPGREKDVRHFFEEVIQLAAKLKIRTVLGIHQKDPSGIAAPAKIEELRRAQNSFLHMLEHTLSTMSETAILIADQAGSDVTLENLLYERTRWRYNPGDIDKPSTAPRFKYEYQSCFLLDQLHRVDSKTSLFIQFADLINFVLQRVHTYSFLDSYKKRGRPLADISKIPVTLDTFRIYRDQISVGYWHDDDVCLVDFGITDPALDADYFPKDYLKGITSYR